MKPSAWFGAALEFHGLTEIPVTGSIAAASTELPPLHSDPCDRLIVATAMLHSLTILTPDPYIQNCEGAETAW